MEIIPQQNMPHYAGIYATAVLDGTILSFEDYPGQQFDLADLQGDEPKHLRFTIDRDSNISIDAAEDYWLFAEIDLPAKTYTSEPVLDDAGEPAMDESGQPQTTFVAQPVTADDIKYTAWQLPKAQPNS